MAPLRAHLGHLFHPLSRAASHSEPTTPDTPESGSKSGSPGVGQSKTASSCELFGILKALAAGGGDVDMDEDEDDMETPTEGDSPTASRAVPLQRERVQPSGTRVHEDKEDVEAKRQALEAQMQNALANTTRDRDLLNSRFTALSLDNMTPSGSAYPRRMSNSRPNLPQSSSYRASETPEYLTDNSESYSEAETTPYTSAANSEHRAEITYQFPEVSDEEKVKAIVEEFGDIAGLMEPTPGKAEPDAERMLAECMGSLFKGIMLIGNLHLTTHRLLFHAQLPPDSELLPGQGNSEGAEKGVAADVLIAGPVTVHRHAALKPARRLWMELSSEMITTYPSGDEEGRVRPLRTILLTSIRRMEPFDSNSPCDFRITYETAHLGSRELFFSVDTEQSAVKWRKSLEAALFRQARHRWRENMSKKRRVDEEIDADGWTTMRICLPLDRVTIDGLSDYHGFVTLVGLDIVLDGERVAWRPEDAAAGDYSGRTAEVAPKPAHRHSLLPFHRSSSGDRHSPDRAASMKKSSSGTGSHASDHEELWSPTKQPTQYIDTVLPPAMTTASGVTVPANNFCGSPKSNSYNFKVAVLNEQAWFAEALQAAVAAAQERKYRVGTVRPKMKLEIAGHDGLASDDEVDTNQERDSTSSEGVEEHGHRLTKDMRKAEKAIMAAKVFGLKEDEPIYLKRCYVVGGLVPARGHIIVTRKYICFWRRATVGEDIKYRFASSDIKGAEVATSIRAGFSGMALKIHGQHDLRFDFWLKGSRDEVISRIQSVVNAQDVDTPQNSTPPNEVVGQRTESPGSVATPHSSGTHATDILNPSRELLLRSRAFPDEALVYLPFVANKPLESNSKLTPRHFVCLTIGSRGDIQPYIALGIRLKEDGHRVTIVTHPEFKEWIEGYDIGHRAAGGDPTALMKLSGEHKMFSPGFFKESLGGFRQWLDDLLLDSWNACADADVLIESPSTMSGIHIAEGLKIPYFRAFTMPWTRTSAYPQAFMVPAFEMGPSFNYSTYVLFDSIIWRASAGQINRWRKKHLKLPATDMSTLSISKVPFLYNFSSAVVPKPLDWNDDITITGYWNLENSDADWTPPDELETFIQKAKHDKRPLVYIGFGSIVVPKPNAMTRNIIAAVAKADVRAIIAKGWSSRGADASDEGGDIEFPDNCYSVEKVPHGWLFPRIDAAMHHGGAGTVGASLRAGLPTLIKPFFGDQHFWAIRVTKLEVGLKVSSLRTEDIASALIKATQDKVMIEKAARVGAKIRAENGVDNALQAIHYNIVRAASDRTKI